jgi:hypothetical protein
LEALEGRLKESEALMILRILRARKRQIQRHNICRVEPKIHLLQPGETPDHQPGADKQNKRKSDLNRYKDASNMLSGPAPRRTS